MTITILAAASGTPGTSPAVKALTHAVRRDVIDCVARGITAPSDMAEVKDHPLGVVSYHVRMLRDYGVLELDHTEPRRGALQHFYRFTDQAVADFESVRDLATTAIRAARRAPKVADAS